MQCVFVWFRNAAAAGEAAAAGAAAMDVDAEQDVEAWKLDLVMHYKFPDSAEVMKCSPSILAPRIPPNVSCVLFGWLVEERRRRAGGAGVRSW